MAIQSTGGTWQPERAELLKSLQDKIRDFPFILNRLKGFEFFYWQQQKINILWTLAELELQDVDPTIKNVSEVTGISHPRTGEFLREFFKDGMLDRESGKYGRHIYTLKEEYLLQMYFRKFQ